MYQEMIVDIGDIMGWSLAYILVICAVIRSFKNKE